MWTARAGIKMQHIPYRGGAPAALAVATGDVQLVLLSPLGIWPQLQAGTARALATGGTSRDAKLPDLPTAAEAGFPGFVAEQWLGLLTTAGTPKDIVTKINTEVNRALRDPELIAKLAQQGTTAGGSTPDEFRKLIATEIRNWKKRRSVRELRRSSSFSALILRSGPKDRVSKAASRVYPTCVLTCRSRVNPRSNGGLALRDASLRDVPQGKAGRERACWNIQTNGSTSSVTRRNCVIGSPMVEIRKVTRRQPCAL